MSDSGSSAKLPSKEAELDVAEARLEITVGEAEEVGLELVDGERLDVHLAVAGDLVAVAHRPSRGDAARRLGEERAALLALPAPFGEVRKSLNRLDELAKRLG